MLHSERMRLHLLAEKTDPKLFKIEFFVTLTFIVKAPNVPICIQIFAFHYYTNRLHLTYTQIETTLMTYH